MNLGGWKDVISEYVADAIVELRLMREAHAEDVERLMTRIRHCNESPTAPYAAIMTIAKAYYKAGKNRRISKDLTEEARSCFIASLDYYRKAEGVEIPSIVAMVYFQQAGCYEELGDLENAAQAYKRVIEKCPSSPLAGVAENNLQMLWASSYKKGEAN